MKTPRYTAISLLFVCSQTVSAVSFTMENLGNMGYPNTYSKAVNDQGQAVGNTNVAAYNHPGFLVGKRRHVFARLPVQRQIYIWKRH